MAYPTTLDELTDGVPSDGAATTTSLSDGLYPHDDHHRALGVAVEAVEAELGLAPSGSAATVVARLDAADVDAIEFVIDGGGSALTTGVKGFLEIPFACTITRATLLADQSGSVVVDVWKDTYANFPPTVADTITASAPPTITTATKSQDSTLTGWTTAVAAGDVLAFNVNSATTVTRVTLSLKVTRS